jgi:hypothetical protein
VGKIEDSELSMDQIITRPINILYAEKINTELRCYDSPCIQIELGEVNIFDFSMEQEIKLQILEKGKQAAISYMKAQPTPRRRHSF